MNALKIKKTVVTEIDAPGFGEWLDKAVKSSSLKISQVAADVGVTTGYLWRLRKEKEESVSYEIVEKLEKVLGKRYQQND